MIPIEKPKCTCINKPWWNSVTAKEDGTCPDKVVIRGAKTKEELENFLRKNPCSCPNIEIENPPC